MTSKRTAALLSIAFSLLLAACDPARTGNYNGNYPDPVRIEVPSGVASDPSGFAMTFSHRHDVRRWAKNEGTYGLGSIRTKDNAYGLWNNLAYAMTQPSRIEALEVYTGSLVAVGTVIGTPDYVYLVADNYTSVQPTGPSGPALTVLPGFHVFHRSCTPDDPNHFDEVALDTKLVYDATAAANETAGLDAYLEGCGIHVSPAFDLGIKVGTLLPLDRYGEPTPVTDLAWAPGSDVVYLLAGTIVDHDVEVLSYSVGATQLSHVAMGDYYAPLEVANGGTSLLVNHPEFTLDTYSSSYYVNFSERLRLSLTAADLPAQLRLPLGTNVSLGTSPMGLLSPDGNTLAVVMYINNANVVALVDVKSGGISQANLATGYPLAWDPSGKKLLVQSTGMVNFQVVPVDGSPPLALQARGDGLRILPVFTTSMPERHRAFWSASGPKVVMQGGRKEDLPVDTREDDRGVKVYDFTTGTTTLMVEPNRQAPPAAPLGIVTATEQVFAWAIQCLGLAETSCTSELRRLSLATGIVDVVARADAALPFAVSPDGAKIVFAYKDGIYLKTIQP